MANCIEPNVSSVIITFNEQRNIRDCLKSVQWVDELILVDSWSTDGTVSIAQEYTDKVLQRDWQDYSAQRNFGLSQARGEWVLFLDADERISEPLALEIQAAMKVNDNSCEGYFIPRQSFYLGQCIRYGEWNPDFQLRLVRRQKATWVGKVHERIVLDGRASFLKNQIYHYTYRDIGHHLQKFIRYSSLSAQESFEKGERTRLSQMFVKPL